MLKRNWIVLIIVVMFWGCVLTVIIPGRNSDAPQTATARSTSTPRPTRTPTATPVPTLTVAELRQTAQSFDVRELTRNTEAYTGQPVAYRGRAVQVMERTAFLSDRVTYTIRFYVDNDSDAVIALRLRDSDADGFRPLTDDMLSIVGIVEGRANFETVLGRQVVLPLIDVRSIELVE